MISSRLVIYHAGCSDGFCAAWLLWRQFPDAEFLPAHYGDVPPDVTGRIVYIVDFSYPRDVLTDMNAKAEILVVLDHHKSAQQNLDGLPFCRFDMDKSGGRMTWEYIQAAVLNKPVTSCGEQPPWLVLYTEDRDLWRFELSESRAVNACMRSHPMEFELWESWLDPEHPDMPPESFYDEGRAILRDQAITVRTKVKQSSIETVAKGGHVMAWRVCNATTLISETAGELAKGTGIGCCWFERADGSRVYSLRSPKDDEELSVDCSRLARFFGGGGHPGAAGFTLPAGTPHPWNQ